MCICQLNFILIGFYLFNILVCDIQNNILFKQDSFFSAQDNMKIMIFTK